MRSRVLFLSAAVCGLVAAISAGIAASIAGSMPTFDEWQRRSAAAATALPSGLAWVFALAAVGALVAGFASRAPRSS